MAYQDQNFGFTPQRKSAAAPVFNFFIRIAMIAACLGAGYGLWRYGETIVRTGVHDYTIQTSDGDEHNTSNRRNVKTDHVHETGDRAREEGRGFQAAGVTLGFWGLIMVWGMLGPLAPKSDWSPLHSLITLISLGGWLAIVGCFFPPWRITTSLSCVAFYIVMAAFLYLASIRDEVKVKKQSQKVFPALGASAVIIGSFSWGYGVGIIAGIFIGLILAVHIALLIPKVRAQFMKPEKKAWGEVQ